MKRVIDWLGLLFVSVGAMIGSGWMLGPLHAAKIAGPIAILSWVVGGLIVMVIAVVFAELSAMLPVTGGIARYAQFSHGGFVSFVMTWITWVAYILIPTAEVQALLQYSANYYPQLITITPNYATHLSALGIITAIILLVLMSYVNILGIRFATQFNKYLVYVKLLVPILVAIVLMNTAFHWENLTAVAEVDSSENFKNMLKALPLAGIIFSYFGFRHSVELGGEVKNPQVTLPLALLGSILICMVIYTLVQTAFIASMPPELLTNGWSNFSFSNYLGVKQGSDSGPFVAIASILGLSLLVKIIFFDALISPFGSALMVVTTNARINYAMAVNGYFPKFFLKLNNKEAPYYAILINLIFGLIMLVPFPGWQEMISLIIAALVVSHAIAPISLYTLRKQVPDQARPFRLPFYGLISRLVFIFLNLIAYWTGWHTLSKMYLALSVGLIYLYIYRVIQDKDHKPFLAFAHSSWIWGYLVGLAVISYAGDISFGGQGYLPFGIDLLCLFIFSSIIFEWSTRQALTKAQVEIQILKEREIGQAFRSS
ncbi:MAG: APC family permease [Gammaproteobacteria bacterium]|nr:APC family permease [Gammaproteobacteria bacterium]